MILLTPPSFNRASSCSHQLVREHSFGFLFPIWREKAVVVTNIMTVPLPCKVVVCDCTTSSSSFLIFFVVVAPMGIRDVQSFSSKESLLGLHLLPACRRKQEGHQLLKRKSIFVKPKSSIPPRHKAVLRKKQGVMDLTILPNVPEKDWKIKVNILDQ